MRLFIGLPLSDDARACTARCAAQAAQAIPGRYTLSSNYHITLAFIGDVPPQRLDDAIAAVSEVSARFGAPRVTLGGLSYFNKPEKAILIRTAQSPDDLTALHEALCSALSSRGLPAQREPFSPHVTLARHADLTTAPAPQAPPPAAFTAEHAVLYLSARDEENVLRYTPLHAAPFAPRSI